VKPHARNTKYFKAKVVTGVHKSVYLSIARNYGDFVFNYSGESGSNYRKMRIGSLYKMENLFIYAAADSEKLVGGYAVAKVTIFCLSAYLLRWINLLLD
jgi:hypothetical protein